ncbi:hypothetical protein DER45DRAFT_126734 [Fusarium avenaceum]|nr:hypothetical protein DER45DRAFT_126734 [Fusarium avenaceum]
MRVRAPLLRRSLLSARVGARPQPDDHSLPCFVADQLICCQWRSVRGRIVDDTSRVQTGYTYEDSYEPLVGNIHPVNGSKANPIRNKHKAEANTLKRNHSVRSRYLPTSKHLEARIAWKQGRVVERSTPSLIIQGTHTRSVLAHISVFYCALQLKQATQKEDKDSQQLFKEPSHRTLLLPTANMPYQSCQAIKVGLLKLSTVGV